MRIKFETVIGLNRNMKRNSKIFPDARHIVSKCPRLKIKIPIPFHIFGCAWCDVCQVTLYMIPYR